MRLICFILAFCLAGCAHHQPASKINTSQQKQSNQSLAIKPGSFSQVVVRGNINVNLHSGYRQSKVILKGASADLIQIHTSVQNHTLHITVGKGFPRNGPVLATIQTQYLNGIKYDGNGVINGTRLKSSMLDIDICNNGQTHLGGVLMLKSVTLKGNGQTIIDGINSPDMSVCVTDAHRLRMTGKANIRRIDASGKSVIHMYWLKSLDLNIKLKDAATVQLAGVVNRLDAELFDNACLKARYLRARRSFVKTHHESMAEISSVEKQHSLALDASDIHYYNLASMHANFMADDGAVLDMRQWNPFTYQNYDHYNKQIH